jgi:hypothetical protein
MLMSVCLKKVAAETAAFVVNTISGAADSAFLSLRLLVFL